MEPARQIRSQGCQTEGKPGSTALLCLKKQGKKHQRQCKLYSELRNTSVHSIGLNGGGLFQDFVDPNGFKFCSNEVKSQ